MKASIIGLGMLGSEVEDILRRAGHKVRAFSFPAFDIRKESDLAEACRGADAVINCAAYTAVDKAESEKELCRQINAEAAGLLGRIAKKNGAFVVHVSTDFVFDGAGEKPWNENDLPNPLNVYGSTKLEGEKLLQESGCKNAIMRVQWTYGKHGVNFVTKMLELAKTRSSLKVVDDQTGAPTNAADMAKAIQSLTEKRIEGLYHFAASGYCNRYESARLIFETLKIKVEVIPCKSSEFPTPARRPLNSRFDCSKIEKATGLKCPAWEKSLTEFLKA